MSLDDARPLIAAFEEMLPDDWRDGALPDEARMRDVLSDERVVVLAAFQNGAPAGYVSGNILPALNRDGSVVMLDDLFVAAPYRGKGLGRRLVGAFKTVVREKASRPVSLWAGTGVDNAPCRRAFERAGGKPSGETYKEYEWRDL